MATPQRQVFVPAPPTMPRPPHPTDRPHDDRSPSGRPLRVQRASPARWAGPGWASAVSRGWRWVGSKGGPPGPLPGPAPPRRAGRAAQPPPPCKCSHKGRRGWAGGAGAGGGASTHRVGVERRVTRNDDARAPRAPPRVAAPPSCPLPPSVPAKKRTDRYLCMTCGAR